MAESAARLCEADRRVRLPSRRATSDPVVARPRAADGPTACRRSRSLAASAPVGRADRETVQVLDIADSSRRPDEYPSRRATARRRSAPHDPRRAPAAGGRAGRRHHGRPRTRLRPFTDKQIELLRDLRRPGGDRDRERPAVHGARGRNRELTEALEQQTATAEILRVIASSPTDLQPVMEAVAENAARLCGATDSSIFRLEGEHLRLVARHGPLRQSHWRS